MLFEKELLQELAYEDVISLEAGEYGFSERTTFRTIYNDISGSGRWHEEYEQVFSMEQNDKPTKYYFTSYRVGSTEMQDECAYENEPDQINCTEVEPKEVVTIQYVPVSKKG